MAINCTCGHRLLKHNRFGCNTIGCNCDELPEDILEKVEAELAEAKRILCLPDETDTAGIVAEIGRIITTAEDLRNNPVCPQCKMPMLQMEAKEWYCANDDCGGYIDG